jgi:addiction module HigA family antidote
MVKLANIHPGEVLLEEFLLPLNISQYNLAKAIGVPQTRIAEIVQGKRRITPDTALRLAVAFGTTARFWLNLQDDYDLEDAREILGDKLALIETYPTGVVQQERDASDLVAS